MEATPVTSAAAAHARYQDFLQHGSLVQTWWQKAEDGNDRACVLGILGNTPDEAWSCAIHLMPGWLADTVQYLFDWQPVQSAPQWGERFYAELERLNGDVPISVLHRWEINTVIPIGRDCMMKMSLDIDQIASLEAQHRRALSENPPSAVEWLEVLTEHFNQLIGCKLFNDDPDLTDAQVAEACARSYVHAYHFENHYGPSPYRGCFKHNAYARAYAQLSVSRITAQDDADWERIYRRTIMRFADGLIEAMREVEGGK